MKKVCLFVALICGFANPLWALNPHNIDGWTDMSKFLVPSDGSRSLGTPTLPFNSTRDSGSKIVFFDVDNGDNSTADVYWWNGRNIVDSSGNSANSEGKEYGTDPLHPNEDAIKPFLKFAFDQPDDRLVTQQSYETIWRLTSAAGGYPDWFVFKRGQTHSEFGMRNSTGIPKRKNLFGGRSEKEPMVIAAYGPESAGRARFEVEDRGTYPFSSSNSESLPNWLHIFVRSIEMTRGFGVLDAYNVDSANGTGEPLSAHFEDVRFDNVYGSNINYPPKKFTLYRSVVRFGWAIEDDGHNQGYFCSHQDSSAVMEDTIFYKNGFTENPKTHAFPASTMFSRNIYQGGGAKMGHVYRNFISAGGGSGSPQIRFGGLIEDSLIVEGYWHIGTVSDARENTWLSEGGTEGQSAVVRNNVQFMYQMFTPNEVTNPESDGVAHPGWGLNIAGSTFGAEISGNIISGAMLVDELGGTGIKGLTVKFDAKPYLDGNSYYQTRNRITNNIVYKSGNTGISIEGDATGVTANTIENNVIVSTSNPVRYGTVDNLTSADQLRVNSNRFYTDVNLPTGAAGFGLENSLGTFDSATQAEGWTDPNRTLKRYVTEKLGLTLLDWDNDPWLDAEEIRTSKLAKNNYDPTGLKTFMAVATNMRLGGSMDVPVSGKPSWTGDYPWDDRFTAKAVVNWVRAGFNIMPEVCGDISGDTVVDVEDLILSLQIIGGEDVTPNIKADCNQDQKIDMTEVLKIFEQLD